MGVADGGRLARLLGGDELSWLVQRVRKRMERGESLDTTITLSQASAQQRAAVDRLLGRRPRAGMALTVPLRAVDEIVRRSGACPDGLAAAVVALTGPVADRSTASAEWERAWDDAFAPLHPVVRHDLAEWLSALRASGLVRRLAGAPEAAGPLLADLAAVIRELPAGGEALGHFAARVTGDAHALDDKRPLATLTLGAARALSGIPDGTGAEWRRAVWASVGLARDDVSNTVLTLGFPGDTTTSTGRALAAMNQAGQPVVLTLRQLVRNPPVFSENLVSVCENPIVVSAAADHLGAHCRPLVCLSGQPSAAALCLLRLLVASGAELRYHGDFDWGGIRIGNLVFDRFPARPWCFDAASYRRAPHGHPLSGSPVVARWDDALADAMADTGRAVEEELVLADLLDDLRL